MSRSFVLCVVVLIILNGFSLAQNKVSGDRGEALPREIFRAEDGNDWVTWSHSEKGYFLLGAIKVSNVISVANFEFYRNDNCFDTVVNNGKNMSRGRQDCVSTVDGLVFDFIERHAFRDITVNQVIELVDTYYSSQNNHTTSIVDALYFAKEQLYNHKSM